VPDAVRPRPGRPSSYQRRFAIQARKLCQLGATIRDLAEFFEVAPSTISLWLRRQVDFTEAVNAGRLHADTAVEQSLFRRALGYEYETVKIFVNQRTREPIVVPYTKRLPP